MFESLATMAVQDWAVFAVWGINAILALALVIIYGRNYKKIGSKFNLGLIIFALAFFFQNVASMYFYKSLLNQVTGFTSIQLAVGGLEFIGLVILLYVTWK